MVSSIMRHRTTLALIFALAIAAIAFIWHGAQPAKPVDTPVATAQSPDFSPVELPADTSPPPRVDRAPAEPPEKPARAEETRVLQSTPTPAQPGQARSRRARAKPWKSAVLQVVTNFEKADVSVNGLPYPEYTPEGEQEGMILPAGGPHIVEVTYEGKTKTYQVNLRADETRILMVELSGLRASTGRARPAPRTPDVDRQPANDQDEEPEDEQGRVTVYSKPNGEIFVDGTGTSEKTPGTVDVEPGRHDIQVKFDNGDLSEKKIIRVRNGSRIKLFFRQRD